MQTGVLYRDDNLERLSSLPSESVDLIYLDPPFFSNRVYEVIWGDEAEVRSFDDRWEGGIQHYIDWMAQRVVELHRVLKPTGSLYLHCDPHASHYLKVMLDSVFRLSMFRNEIIWRRSGSHNSSRRYGPIHDVILFYTKSDSYTWNPPRRPYMRGHVEEYFVQDDTGRWRTNYYGNVLTGSGLRNGESGLPWRGIDPSSKGRHWAIPRKLVEEINEDLSGLSQHQKLDRLFDLGFVTIDPGAAWPMYEHYITPSDGTPAPDIWAYQPYTKGTVFGTEEDVDADVRWLSPRDAERLKYPTQKPESLLSRIIESSSNRDGVVLDPFCGCGTTVAVADRLNREWIGIDISPTAIEVMRRRLLRQGVDPIIENAPDTVEELQRLKPFEFQNWVINAMNGTHSPRKVGDMGIDGFSFLTRDPIQVKQSSGVGRPTLDSFETAMQRNRSDTGYLVAFSFTKGAVEEVARAKGEGLSIKLVKVAELLLLNKRPGSRIASVGPQPDNVRDLPIAPMRKRKDLPTAEELIASARSASA